MGSPHQYAINGMSFAYFSSASGAPDCDQRDQRRNLFENRDGFSFS